MKTTASSLIKILMVLTLCIAATPRLSAFQLTVSGGNHPAVIVPASPSTGLENIYVVYSTENGTITADGLNDPSSVRWLEFSNLGAAYSQDVESSRISINGMSSILALTPGDKGYVIETPEGNKYIWVTDYSSHRLTLNSLTISDESDCSSAILDVDGNGSQINCFTINGRPTEISREMEITYYTSEYNETLKSFSRQEKKSVISYFNRTIALSAPYCDTEFTIAGDRFLKAWNEQLTITSPYYRATAVDGYTTATQETHTSDNMITDSSGGEDGILGGSAPCEITFTAAVTETAVFKEWQFSTSPEFEELDLTFSDTELNYTFNDQGTTYVRFMAADDSGNCQYTSDTYTISIGDSRLLCPNAFSPQGSPGVNDEWKVSYKSLISFECHIFNSRGVEIFSFKNPDQGWDGKYKGKYVPAGVYYYVIQAKGSDGKNYKLSGDINIVNFHGGNSYSSGGEDNPVE